MLSDQVKLISEKLAYLTPNEQRSILVNNHKKASKQVWVKKEDNLCLVSHTALKILDTCLWYLDSGCSKHMTCDKTLLKKVQMGKGGRITYGDGSQSKVIGKGIIDIPGLGTSKEALGHLNFSDMLKIAGKDIVKGLPKMEKTGKGICGSCQLGKQTRAAHKKTSGIQTFRNLEFLHMDLMGPNRTASLGGKRYILVIVDDFSRYIGATPIREKYDALDAAQHLFKKIQVEQSGQIMRIHSDHGREFKNSKFEEFCLSYGIKQEFSSPITPQQNGVVERKNRVIQEMARVMIHSKNLAQHFFGEAVNTACHIINRVYLRPETSKTPYEIWRGKKPTVKYFRTFGSKCYILRDRKNLGKFDPKRDEGIFLGYSSTSRAYRVFNKRKETVMESINVVIDDEEVDRPSSGEENQLAPVEVTDGTTDNDKASPSVSPDEPPSSLTALDTTSSTSVDEDTPANPPKRSWVKHKSSSTAAPWDHR
jgi:hypothetical protein